jgi:DNA/RNA endonuclease YhcR with UshA esterase domain
VIWGNVRKEFKIDLADKKYAQAMVQVTGKVELYKDKPQIVITDPGQLSFVVEPHQ